MSQLGVFPNFLQFELYPKNIAISLFFYGSGNCKSLDNRERPGPVESSEMLTDFLDFVDFYGFHVFFLEKKMIIKSQKLYF